jgi:hypothetical protein
VLPIVMQIRSAFGPSTVHPAGYLDGQALAFSRENFSIAGQWSLTVLFENARHNYCLTLSSNTDQIELKISTEFVSCFEITASSAMKDPAQHSIINACIFRYLITAYATSLDFFYYSLNDHDVILLVFDETSNIIAFLCVFSSPKRPAK